MMTETVVVMAVFDPDIDVLRDQFASLDTQYYQDFSVVAVIADLASHDLVTQAIAGTNLQVEITTPDTALSAPQAFEFGLAVAIKGFPSAQFFAFCDQDDLWTRNRLSHCRQALIGAGTDLVHSDATLIDQNGYETHRSLFATEGRLENPTPRDLLYRNTVTGMTTFFTRNLVERALPFPAQDGVHFYHDLWLALLARTG
ncbi:MAG: glycosyl transferase family 1, partial [Planktomarina sp.]